MQRYIIKQEAKPTSLLPDPKCPIQLGYTKIVPSTLKRQSRTETARPRPTAARGGEARARGAEDRDAYRRAPGGSGDKKADVGAGTAEMEFRGGYGRGRGAGAPPPQ
ncbi:ribosomal 40S subunit protein S10A [Homalodisca vitripennis]|nr:ribosomal 40S subunit protein S10A [Homalodisca vitripennis]